MNLQNDKVFIGKNPPKTRAKNIIWIDTSTGDNIPKKLTQNGWMKLGSDSESDDIFIIYILQPYDGDKGEELKFYIYDTFGSLPLHFPNGKCSCIGYSVKKESEQHYTNDGVLDYDDSTSCYSVSTNDGLLFVNLIFEYRDKYIKQFEILFSYFENEFPIIIKIKEIISYTKLGQALPK